MKKILLLLSITFIYSSLSAQQTFQSVVGGSGSDIGWSIVQTTDGGYAIGGNTYSFGADSNVYVIKLDSSGVMQWTRTIGGSAYDAGRAIIQTNDGGFAITGRTNYSEFQVYVVKLDSAGNLEWTRKINASLFDQGYSIIQTNDGGFAISGSTYNSFTGFYDAYIIKLDANGAVQWTNSVSGFSNGGYSIVQTSDHGYAVSGTTGSFGAGSEDFYFVKLDSSGNQQWVRTIGGPGFEMMWPVSTTLTKTNDGGYALTGFTTSFGAGGNDVYVVKLDSSGNLQWTRTVGGPGDEQGNSIVQTTDHGYVVTGSTTSFGAGADDVYVLKLDSAGNLQWSGAVGGAGNDFGYSVVQARDGGYTIAGSTTSFGNGNSDVYIIKLNSSGNSCGNLTSVTSTAGTGGIAGILGGFSGSLSSLVDTGGVTGSGGTLLSICVAGCTATVTANDTTTFCQGDSIMLSANSSAAYLWSTNDTTQSITVSTSGIYFVTVTDSNGCSATSALDTVTVNPLPAATVTASDSTTFCQGDSIVLSANSSAGYLWSTNETTQSITVSTSGFYFVTVTDSNGCSAASALDTVTMNPLPAVSFGGLPDTICALSSPVTLTGNPPGGTFSGSGVTGNTFDPAAAGAGSHVVTYSFTDGSGCSNGSSDSVFVDICLGTTNLSQPVFEIKIFPNPSRNYFTLKGASANKEKCSLLITDLAGRVIEKWNHISGDEDFNFGFALSDGFYFAEVVKGTNRKIIRLIKN